MACNQVMQALLYPIACILHMVCNTRPAFTAWLRTCHVLHARAASQGHHRLCAMGFIASHAWYAWLAKPWMTLTACHRGSQLPGDRADNGTRHTKFWAQTCMSRVCQYNCQFWPQNNRIIHLSFFATVHERIVFSTNAHTNERQVLRLLLMPLVACTALYGQQQMSCNTQSSGFTSNAVKSIPSLACIVRMASKAWPAWHG